MKSLLEVIGIPSNYCLVMSGSTPPRLINEFPSSQFNHVFLCAPLNGDTVWLECTSQVVPCGYIGDFTDDRDVLLIDENGGKVVHTKSYTANETVKSCHATFFIDEDGNGTVKMKNVYKGLYYEDIQYVLLSDDAEKKKQLYERIEIPNIELITYNHREMKERIPVVYENIDMYVRNTLSVMGDRLLVTMNQTNKFTNVPRRVSDRKSDILIRRAYTEIDTVVYQMPDGFTVTKVPQGTTITSPFG
ncbi:MAG: hypothetical protein HC906_06540 [Bacteroidales bacterium]|nr:hypothetical protein [Bacteroidales bacterium]